MKFLIRKYNQLLIKFLNKYSRDDVKITKAKYYCKNKVNINLDNPTEFMEKIQWLKLYHYTQNYGNFVDKYEARNYVETKIGSQYLNTIYGVFDAVDAINFKNLPNQFVLKGTHGSGYNVIVKDKNQINENKIIQQLNCFLRKNYYFENRESIYKNVKPRILVEKYISEVDCEGLIDYKFYCFHGVPKYVLVKVCLNGEDKKCYYDLNWNKIIPEQIPNDFLNSAIEKPSNFEEMLTIAAKLATDFIFIRVDLYSIAEKIIFGELTFFPTGGNKRISVERFNKEFGDLMHLPNQTS